MSKISMRMLTDIDKETVDFMPNYDDPSSGTGRFAKPVSQTFW